MSSLVEHYAAPDVERRHPEPGRHPSRDSERGDFERDRARIVHSGSLRRLAAKTQVVGPSSNDFTRNRLTHSLEVAQVGRELARALGTDPDLVEAACLAHDLGHPPFGHNGERALDQACRQAGGFEANAQTFRLLTRLEPKTFTADGRSVGLNLTRATLDASTKYPWPFEDGPAPAGRHADGLPRSVRKFGVYVEDLPAFTWMRKGTRPLQTCVEAQLMDFADDVAYSVHDVEDGVVSGRIELSSLDDAGRRRDLWATVQEWYAPSLRDAACEAAFARLHELPAWPQASYDGGRRQLAGLKNLTSRLINRLCQAVQTAVAVADLPAPLVRYAADLPVPADTLAEIAVLKGIAAHLVMKADDRVALLQRQRDVLTELVQAYTTGAPGALDPVFRLDFEAAVDDAGRLRVVADQVASLTDPSAVDAHRRLCRTA